MVTVGEGNTRNLYTWSCWMMDEDIRNVFSGVFFRRWKEKKKVFVFAFAFERLNWNVQIGRWMDIHHETGGRSNKKELVDEKQHRWVDEKTDG